MQYPHCDSRVLHAPGLCEVCDLYPTWQQDRIDLGIKFTGQDDDLPWQDPAQKARSLEAIELWPGNRPYPKENNG